eukprot:11137058-Lingulodinium_polyedra.AAC.1
MGPPPSSGETAASKPRNAFGTARAATNGQRSCGLRTALRLQMAGTKEREKRYAAAWWEKPERP